MASSPASSDAGASSVAPRPGGLGRALRAVSRHGVRGTAQRIHRWVVAPLWRRVHLHEEHVWLTVPISASEPMPAGYALREGTVADLPAVAAVGGVAPVTAQRYLDRGARLYIAHSGEEIAFCTWIHAGSVPALAARGGALDLPAGVVSFEDSLAAPAHRRSGIASVVVHEVTAREHRAGATLFVTRVATDNAPALKWSQKLGCVPVATVRLRRVLGAQRVSVEPLPGGEPVAQMLAERL